ncbi:MAG: amidohydrolase family protein [Clostridia bacterium]|nr:amidohydrolase family protein [Clostridia bacterium]
MASILIKNGRVWDGERFSCVDILTVEENISSIAPHISEKADFTYDASGMLVSAGLVDIHTHMRQVSSDEYGIPIDAVCLPFGVTAAVEASAEKGDGRLLSAFAVKGAAFVACRIEHDTAVLDMTERLLHAYGDAGVGVKVFFDRACKELKSTKPLREICAFAHARGKKVLVHCNHSPTTMEEIVDTLQGGDIVTHIYHGGEHTIADHGYAAYDLAKQKGIVLDAGMAGHVHTDFSVLRSAIKAGYLPDTISTDITRCSAFYRGGRYGLTMCMSIMRAVGMGEEDILRAVTSNPARALGMAGKWGCLRVGGTADIAVLDYTQEGFDLTDAAGHHITSKKGYRCALTIADGQIVYKH